jgi:hypothetical protein
MVGAVDVVLFPFKGLGGGFAFLGQDVLPSPLVVLLLLCGSTGALLVGRLLDCLELLDARGECQDLLLLLGRG